MARRGPKKPPEPDDDASGDSDSLDMDTPASTNASPIPPWQQSFAHHQRRPQPERGREQVVIETTQDQDESVEGEDDRGKGKDATRLSESGRSTEPAESRPGNGKKREQKHSSTPEKGAHAADRTVKGNGTGRKEKEGSSLGEENAEDIGPDSAPLTAKREVARSTPQSSALVDAKKQHPKKRPPRSRTQQRRESTGDARSKAPSQTNTSRTGQPRPRIKADPGQSGTATASRRGQTKQSTSVPTSRSGRSKPSSTSPRSNRRHEDRLCCRCNCCPGLWAGFVRIWHWRGWGYIRRHLPLPIALGMIGLMIVLGTTGPMTGMFYDEVDNVKFGALGFCDTSSNSCTTAVFYSKSILKIKDDAWVPEWSLPALLLGFGICGGIAGLSLLHVLFQRYCGQRWSRSRCRNNCCEDRCKDVEAQRRPKRIRNEAEKRQIAVQQFHLTMDLTFFFVIVLSVLLSVWSGAISDNPLEGQTVSDVLIGFVAAWGLTRLIYGEPTGYTHTAGSATIASKVGQTAKKTGGRVNRAVRRRR